jgi:hypothetical protein
MFGCTTTITTALIHRIARGRRFMGDLSMGDRLITGITGRDIVRRRLGIDRMGRTSRVIDRRRIMVDARRILEMAAGRREMVEGHDHPGMGMVDGHLEMVEELVRQGTVMETGVDRRVMALGLDLLETAGILGMVEGLVPLATVVGLDHRGMAEVAGLLLLLGLRQHHVLPRRRGRHRRLVLRQPLLIGQLLDLRREGLIPGIRRVVRSRLNGLSRRLVRGRVDLVGITMAQRRGRRVIAAKPVLAVAAGREVNRNEAFQT